VAILLFAISRQELDAYWAALQGATVVCFALFALDLSLLAKPETIEMIVRRAPTWQQLLAWRQRLTYFSLRRKWNASLAACAACVRPCGGDRGYRRASAYAHSMELPSMTLEPSNMANPMERTTSEDPDHDPDL
jgi:hypothetical protein